MFNKIDTLTYFFNEPTREFNVREIARIQKKSPATTSKTLKALAKQGLLKSRAERMLHLYKANLESEGYRDLKAFDLISRLKKSGLIAKLDKFYLKPSIIIFGSSLRGEDIETSDIDLIIISEKTEHMGNLEEFERKLRRRIQLIPVKDLKALKNKHLINNAINGTVIQGEINWI